MTKNELTAAMEAARAETKAALQTVYDTLNKGQQQKIVKDETVKALFDLYGVNYE
jgi:Fe2+ or Zn2+ uptake regulation protein